MPTEKTPPYGTPAVAAASVSPQAEPPAPTAVDEDEAVELNPTEQRLESVRGKLEQKHEELVGKNRDALERMAALDIEIAALDAQLPSLRAAVLNVHADLHQAQGAHAAMGSLIARLRQPGETNPVQGLEKLIEENRALARQLAVTLVGEDDADALLENPVINEGTARGIVFDIKSILRKKVKETEKALIALVGKVRTSDPQYIEAAMHLHNAELDLDAAETRRDDLLGQIQRALATIQSLRENIKSTDAVARKLEEEQEALRTGNVQTNDGAVQDAAEKERRTHELLGKKRAERGATEISLREFTASEERVTRLLAALDEMLATYTTATECLAQVPTLIDQMGCLQGEFSQRWTEASHDIQPALVGIGSGVNDAIAGTMGYGIAMGDKVIEELRSHEALLGELIRRFDNASIAADTPAADPKDLPWQAYEELVAASENLRRFLEHDWERLQGGSVDKINALCGKLRERLERVLKPLAIIRKASGEIAALHSPAVATPAAAELAPPPPLSRPAAETVAAPLPAPTVVSAATPALARSAPPAVPDADSGDEQPPEPPEDDEPDGPPEE